MAVDLTPQAVGRIDPATLSNGFRASKIVGAAVVNAANEKIGTVDDLLVAGTDRVPYAVLSVGGFLGLGDHLVAVAYESLRFTADNKIMLNGATKDELKAMPEFKYASK